MKEVASAILLFIFSVLLAVPPCHSFDYVMGTGTYREPTNAKPAKGATVIDPNFHTTIRRVTDGATEGEPGGTGYSNMIGVEYSRSDPENADGTKLILTKEEFYDLLCPMTDDDERKIGRPRWFDTNADEWVDWLYSIGYRLVKLTKEELSEDKKELEESF